MNAVVETVEQAPVQQAGWVSAMVKAEPKFKELAELHGAVNWKAEANYARQLIQKNDRLMQCKPQSIADAVINVGAIGLSLSPAEKLAYLVPRGNECVLDISYTGLIKLATDTGACEYIRADIVRENDSFEYRGPAEKAVFSTASPFDPEARGKIVGVYAEAKLASGGYLTEIMNMQDIATVEAASKAKYGPWKDYWGEMARKTVIKRLFKTIPPTKQSKRVDTAMHVVNQHEGLEEEAEVIEHKPTYDHDLKVVFDEAVASDNGAQLWHMSRSLPTSVWVDLYNSGEKGKVTKLKQAVTELQKQGLEEFQAAALELKNLMDADDTMGAVQIVEDYEHQRSTLDEQLKEVGEDLLEWVAGLAEG